MLNAAYMNDTYNKLLSSETLSFSQVLTFWTSIQNASLSNK